MARRASDRRGLLGLVLFGAAWAACAPSGGRPAAGTGGQGTGGKPGTGGGASAASGGAGGQGPAGRPDGLPAVSTACAGGAKDPVARALCKAPAPVVRGLADLHGALDLRADQARTLTAAATHSVGLAGRLVSAINPRVFVFRSFSGANGLSFALDDIVALAFSRGEQAVELVGYDPAAGDFNFYLLVFEQGCNATRCTPRELFTSAVEEAWTGWRLYVDRDLEDTPFDCLSCHRPDGRSARKRLLMRELVGPWMHWSDLHFQPEGQCPPGGEPIPSGPVPYDELSLVPAGAGGAATYAGVPLDILTTVPSGHDLSSFIGVATRVIGEGGLEDAFIQLGEPMRFDSQTILCEGSVGKTDAWRGYRAAMLARGFPTPHHALDVLDAGQRAEAAAGFAEYLGRRPDADAFAIGASLMSNEAEESVGFVPRASDDARTILRQMCIRCHDGTTDPALRRARFNVEALDTLTAEAAAAVWKRITLPRTSPELMPPLRAGELPPPAVARLKEFLRIP
jgi:hypothetical protein